MKAVPHLKLFYMLLFLALIFVPALPFDVDYASFRYGKDINLVELYYSIPYRELSYRVENDTIFAELRVDYSIHSFTSLDSVSDSAFRRVILPSFKLAQERDLTMVDNVIFFARPGTYLLNLNLNSVTPGGKIRIGSYSDTLKIKDFSDAPSLSDIELATLIASDTGEGKFNKCGLLVMPNPSGQFGLAYDQINVYLEIYNLVPDSSFYELAYGILDQNRVPVKTFTPEKSRKFYANIPMTFALSAKGFRPDTYFVSVRLKDLSTGNEATGYKRLNIASPAVVSQKATGEKPVSEEERHYYESIQFLATETEMRQFRKLAKEGKEKFLERFWAKHDFSEFLSRIKTADLKFGFGGKKGPETDRGRIYIKYGPPDEIEDLPMTEQSNPQQRWRYYKKGLKFIFIDINGDGYLQFIYSNSREERNHPNWEKYIDIEEIIKE